MQWPWDQAFNMVNQKDMHRYLLVHLIRFLQYWHLFAHTASCTVGDAKLQHVVED